MKTSIQDIHDLLAAIANDVEEIKAQLNGNTAGTATGLGMAGKDNAISNDVVVGNGSAASNPDQTIADVKQLLEQIAGVCTKLPGRMKSYYSQLLLRIPKDLREELTRNNDARKRKGQPTVEDKIDNTLTMAVAVYDRLNQIEYALRSSTPKSELSGQIAAHGKTIRRSANGKSVKSGIIAWLKSAWSREQRLRSKRQSRRYRKPYILCAISICLLYFALSIFSWQQWHYYRDENIRLRLTADKYHVDSIILRELYPQAAITLSAYEHIIESEGAEKAIEVFWNNFDATLSNKSK